MITDITDKSVELERALIVGADEDSVETIEQAFPAADYIYEDNLLSGMIRLAKESVQSIFVFVSHRNENEIISALSGYKKICKDVKIVLITDVYGEPIARKAISLDLASDYLIRPIFLAELRSVIARLFNDVSGRRTLAEDYFSEENEENIDISRYQYTGDFLRESAELVRSAELGFAALLGRVCWSAMFLLNAQAARITIEGQTSQVGKDTDVYNVSFPLSEAGREFGRLDLLVSDGKVRDKKAIDFLEQIVPGLVRLARSQVKLKELANTDELTGLANRRFMQEVLERLFERAKTERFRITLVIFDFDDFKHYNDTYGHGAGDEILRESAMLIKRCIRSKDLAVRYGGDEFAVILWDWQQRRQADSEHPRSALSIMQRFRKLLRQHYFPRLGPDAVGRLTISGGLASYPWDANNIDELIERADSALLEAKRSGKDRIYLVGQGAENVEDS